MIFCVRRGMISLFHLASRIKLNMNEEKTLPKESEVLISEANKSANSTLTYDVKLIAEGKAP